MKDVIEDRSPDLKEVGKLKASAGLFLFCANAHRDGEPKRSPRGAHLQGRRASAYGAVKRARSPMAREGYLRGERCPLHCHADKR